ncbi:MAG: HipA domain-containing protein [Spiribacter salinus]|uniref:HipA domain-containing protein n=1 Tax=Spiribacter salinus TaxID=1335746 RepID=A0A540VNN1_9GAMM|nr:MAG: HipA domain-containing protein [Spiribacter salinus]
MAERRTYIYIDRAGEPVPAGELVYDAAAGTARFRYGRRYTQRRDRVAVDPVTLPLPEPDVTPGWIERQASPSGHNNDLLFGGLRDAVPDGWGQHVLDRLAGGELDLFDYLVAAPTDRVGALATGPDLDGPRRVWPANADPDPESVQPAPAGEVVDLEDMQATIGALDDEREIETLPPAQRRFLLRGSSLGGARPKASTMHNGRPHIAKFARKDDRYPRPRIEYACMRLAEELGLNVPAVDCIGVGEYAVYLIERFDRVELSDGRTGRVPFISGLTLLDASESTAHHHSYGELAQTLRRYGSAPDRDALELFQRMVFNVLVNNTDDHLRNHGYLHDGAAWRLSPLYDIEPFPSIGIDERVLALALGQGRHASIANAVAAAADFGLTADDARDIATSMREHVAARWEGLFQEAGIGERDRKFMARAFYAATGAA